MSSVFLASRNDFRSSLSRVFVHGRRTCFEAQPCLTSTLNGAPQSRELESSGQRPGLSCGITNRGAGWGGALTNFIRPRGGGSAHRSGCTWILSCPCRRSRGAPKERLARGEGVRREPRDRPTTRPCARRGRSYQRTSVSHRVSVRHTGSTVPPQLTIVHFAFTSTCSSGPGHDVQISRRVRGHEFRQ